VTTYSDENSTTFSVVLQLNKFSILRLTCHCHGRSSFHLLPSQKVGENRALWEEIGNKQISVHE